MREGSTAPIGVRALFAAAYSWKAAGLLGATVILAAILAYAFLVRSPYTATAQVSIGQLAFQLDEWGVASTMPIERLDDAERHLQYQALPDLNLQLACTVQARMFQQIFLSCSGDSEEESRQRTRQVVDGFLERHRVKVDAALASAREKASGDKRRLEMLLKASKSARTAQEQIRAAIEISHAKERVAIGAALRKLDRATLLEPPGIMVTRKTLTPLTIAVALILSIAFGAFVSVCLAAASLLRQEGDASRPSS